MKRHFWQTTITVAACAVSALSLDLYGAVLLNDPLQGSTIGVRSGGTFVTGGWQVTQPHDCIIWHLPRSVAHGAVEFYVRGLISRDPNPILVYDNDLFEMYDYTFESADTNYMGFRNNPYKMWIIKDGPGYDYRGTADTCSIIWVFPPDDPEYGWHTGVLNWSPETNYKLRVEWGPVSGGNSLCKILRNDVVVWQRTLAGAYTPTGHSVRIGWSSRAENPAPINAVFSNLTAYDLTASIPAAPTLVKPATGQTLKTPVVFIQWSEDSHTQYQVQVNTAAQPDTDVAWDSGEVSSSRDFAYSGTLQDNAVYYAFVRLGTTAGWGPWSAARQFSVNAAYTPPGPNGVVLQGNSLADNNGPFLGLGFTYMASMWFCKNNPTQYRSDLAFMSARGYNYQRILSEVPGADSLDYWWGRSINASNYRCQHGTWAYEWPDYDQQLKDCIDIAYDQYGIRTEITVFGGAGESFPTYSGRQAHCQRVLNDLAGREHKILLIEVANEAWQTGFPGEQGRLDLRSLGQYLADRTSIPIALTAMCTSEATQGELVNLYSGSAADITTEHFERYLNGPEGHWFPVRDPWRVVDVPGLMPASSNEPIGPGSSVASEDHPIHIASAAAFAWIANLNSYVYHTSAGVRHDVRFEDMAGVNDLVHLRQILPPDVSSWIRNDGKEPSAPFTAYCNGQPNKYWTDLSGATSGCHRNIGSRKGDEFVCYPQGVLGGGLELEARQYVAFKVYNPLTGAVVLEAEKNAGDRFTLAREPAAYIIKGTFSPPPPRTALLVKAAGPMAINADPSDWTLSEFTAAACSGQTGDIALVGYDDGGAPCYGAYAQSGVLPANAADHTARVYSRHDTTSLYFLVRCDDDDLRYTYGVDMNWANDCVEVYIDPAHDRGSSAMNDSTSDIQLVIDANNQKNVYMCTDTYKEQVLAGVTSAVTRDATGWWLEVQIQKNALSPAIPVDGTIGLDFNFRDNDNDNDPTQTTVYTWNDSSTVGFPSKIPDHWAEAVLPDVTPPATVASFTATAANGQITLNWTNPSDTDFAGTMIRCKTSGYPTGPADGTLVADQAGTPGSGGQQVHTGARCNTSYYYAAFAHDAGPNYASGAITSKRFPCGDFDNDADVDLSDFSFFQVCFEGPNRPVATGCGVADFDVDTDVDLADFSVFQACFNGPNRPPACSP